VRRKGSKLFSFSNRLYGTSVTRPRFRSSRQLAVDTSATVLMREATNEKRFEVTRGTNGCKRSPGQHGRRSLGDPRDGSRHRGRGLVHDSSASVDVDSHFQSLEADFG
jgi:hypothetical protein